MKTKLLLVEDEDTISKLLSEFLESEGYEVIIAIDGDEGWHQYQKVGPDVCIFDIMIPKLSGFDLLKKIRITDKNTPILLLTARVLKEDVIKGLKYGADDYLTKPFSIQELFLRLANIQKRNSITLNNDSIELGKYIFNSTNQTLVFNTEINTLTAMETNLLLLLNTYKNNTISRKQILKELWGNDDMLYSFRSIDVFVSKLRKYLCKDSSIRIISIRGIGYRLVIT